MCGMICLLSEIICICAMILKCDTTMEVDSDAYGAQENDQECICGYKCGLVTLLGGPGIAICFPIVL